MAGEGARGLGPSGSGSMRRRPVRMDRTAVRVIAPGELSPLPVVEASLDGVDPGEWLAEHARTVSETLAGAGAILLRGFACDPAMLEHLVRRVSGEPLEYSYRSTPRRTVSGRVYTSTEYPADQTIPLHNEMSYANVWPRRLWFLCVLPATEGGATPVASGRTVRERIPSALRDRLERTGVEYRRRYGPHLDLPWRETFQTSDRTEVDAICRRQGLRHTWLDDDHLVTSVVRPASIEHPTFGLVWFNQAHLFHPAALPLEDRRALAAAVGEDGMPRDARFGDGTPIEDDDIAEILAAYEAASIDVAWRARDLLLVDNEAMTHGRRPFLGERRVVVAMSSGSDAKPTGV